MVEPSAKDESYCTYCGVDLDPAAETPTRFGQAFCGDAHADAFVQEARATRAESAACDDQATDAAPARRQASSGWDLKRTLKMAACCGLPLLVVVLLAGGGGALLGAGAAVLPLLAVLACPLGMLFMMRAMQGHGRGDGHTISDRPSTTRETKKP